MRVMMKQVDKNYTLLNAVGISLSSQQVMTVFCTLCFCFRPTIGSFESFTVLDSCTEGK
jgi:hypothetical protein